MSMHSKTKKYATYGKKSKSRIVEVDSGSGRSAWHNHDSWSASLSSEPVDKENRDPPRTLKSPRPKTTITQPSTEKQRNDTGPFSTHLLTKYALVQPTPPTPKSPLEHGQHHRPKMPSEKQSSEQSTVNEPPSVKVNAIHDPKEAQKPSKLLRTPPPQVKKESSSPKTRQSNVKNLQPISADAGLEVVSKSSSNKPESTDLIKPAASSSKAEARPAKHEKIPSAFLTPFEIVPPTPSIIKVSRKIKTSSPVKKRSAPPPTALRVRPINTSVPTRNTGDTKGKSSRSSDHNQRDLLPPAPQKPNRSNIVDVGEDTDEEVLFVRKSKNDAKPPLPPPRARRQAEASSCVSHSKDGKGLSNPFKAPESSASSFSRPSLISTSRLPSPDPDDNSFDKSQTERPETSSSMSLLKSNQKLAPAIEPLLRACGQQQAYDFTSFTQHTSLLSPHLSAEASDNLTWRKLGEATYSEIFVRVRRDLPRNRQLQDESSMVVKVVPIHLPNQARRGRKPEKINDKDNSKPEETSVQDALRELTVTRLMNEDDPGGSFISLLGGHVVQGDYPKEYLDEWNAYKRSEPQKAINFCPDAFDPNQYYLVLCLPYGGTDLETFKLKSWAHAASILWQVAYGLATAERSWHFEHRDLHWGNVLIKECEVETGQLPRHSSVLRSPVRKSADNSLPTWPACLEPEAAGIKICIIDYSLSSCDDSAGSRLHGGLEEEVIFEGQGDYQFDIYRMMRQTTGSDWQGFYPVTNLMWLHYLVGKLLRRKGLKQPTLSAAPATGRKPGRAQMFGAYDRQKRVLSGHRGQDCDDDMESRAYNALVLAERALGEVIGAVDGSGDSSLADSGFGLGEIKDSEGFLTWFSVAPELSSM